MTIELMPEQEEIVRNQLSTGEYANANQVVVEALNFLERRHQQIKEVTSHLQEGVEQAERGEFSSRSVLDIIADRRRERAAN